MSKVRKIPTRAEGNTMYPLPHDYWQLTGSGQRDARVNACRQHMLKFADKEDKARAYIASLSFFDDYYLTQERDEDDNVTFDPMFYRSKLPTPSFHWAWARRIILHQKFVGVGPRGGAKSFFHARRMIHAMVSSPMYSFTYATSTNDLAEEMGDRVKYQCYSNKRVHDDWAGEYGGRIKPRRSDGRQGMSSFSLTNRSSFFGTSAQSRQRGLRPVEYVLDDPEYDPKASTPMEVLREGTEELVFTIAMPMVQQAGTKLQWTGTFISLRHYLWEAMQTETVLVNMIPEERSLDPRFDRWARSIVPACLEVDGKLKSYWPSMAPVNRQEKIELKLDPETKTLEEIREDVGDDVFNAEYLCRPGTSKGAFFPPFTKVEHDWWIENPDPLITSSPYLSKALICWYRNGKDIIKMSLDEFCRRFPRLILCDASDTAHKGSDYKTSLCVALTDNNEYMSLDLWAGQAEEDVQVAEIFRMADRWRASCICCENIKAGKNLNDRLNSQIQTRALDVLGVQHMPGLKPFNPGMTEKTTKIKNLKWRTVHHKAKFPLNQMTSGPWQMFADQYRNFHPHAKDGGLRKDDCILLGTLVRTKRGDIPIETVTTDDFVLTRWGWRRVLKSWPRGRKPVITRFGLTATPDHKVWTENRGWVAFASLEKDDIILSWDTQESASSERPSRSTAESTTAIRRARVQTSESTSTTWTAARSLAIAPYNETCGRTTKARSRINGRSTTRTATPATTSLATSNVCLQPSTTRGTEKPNRNSVKQSRGSTDSIRSDRSLTSVQRVCASSAALPFTDQQDPGFAPTSIAESCARTGSSPDDFASGEGETWDLMVEGCHEFFAGGILVHNCLDTWSFAQFVFTGRPEQHIQPAEDPKTDYQRLLEGETHDKLGNPLIAQVFHTLTRDQILYLLNKKTFEEDSNQQVPAETI